MGFSQSSKDVITSFSEKRGIFHISSFCDWKDPSFKENYLHIRHLFLNAGITTENIIFLGCQGNISLYELISKSESYTIMYLDSISEWFPITGGDMFNEIFSLTKRIVDANIFSLIKMGLPQGFDLTYRIPR